MDSNLIFGPNVILPSIEGVKSTCEDELCVLMKEIDLAFERKHKELLTRVTKLEASCREKDVEIENLKSSLRITTQSSKHNLEDQTSHLLSRITKLKEKNETLNSQNSALQSKVNEANAVERQLESLKRSLLVQQEENASLREKFTKLSEKHWSLEEAYQRMRNMVDLERKDPVDKSQPVPSNFIDVLVAEETEKNLQSESEHLQQLESQINNEIEKLRKSIRKNAA